MRHDRSVEPDPREGLRQHLGEQAQHLGEMLELGEERLLLEQAPVGLIVAEAPSGRIVVFNDEAARLLGHPAIVADAISDYRRFGFILGDGSPFEPDEIPLARALAGEHGRDRLVRYRRGDGVVVRRSVNASPLRSHDGRIVGATTTFVDVTERYLLEARVRSRLERLASMRAEEAKRRASEIDRLAAGLEAISRSLEERVRRRSAELAQQARHDPLTGLPNRVLFEERLERAIDVAERYGRRLAVLFIDFDAFKAVNDALGHEAGDRVLAEAARRLRRALRRSDTLARYGGDEFIVLASEIATADDARVVAEALEAALDAPFTVEGSTVALRASVGVSVYPDDAGNASRLKRNADHAMYLAKRAGATAVAVSATATDGLCGGEALAVAEPGAGGSTSSAGRGVE
jgi:diguanylate cyclase (GGDEF)-like protein/PAS domain S-box-containing protein